jgi:hypothetical protein
MIFTLIDGQLLNWFYFYAKENKSYPFWSVVFLHALYNLYGILIETFTN